MTKRAQLLLRQLQQRIERVTYESLRAGRSAEQIDSAVAEVVARVNFAQLFAGDLAQQGEQTKQAAIAEAQKRYQWVLDRTQQQNVDASVRRLSAMVSAKVVRAEGNAKERISQKIAEGIAAGKSNADIVQDAVGATSGLQHVARTWTNTARAAYQTTSTVAVAREAGVDKFKYVGASPEREFCKRWYGESHELSFWKKLNNGQGLPVVPYCGGFNCTHTLEPDV